ncbi:MAG TPA: ABC transporter ATP-binding protein, partial [Verrucomicrobiae bacterium]|nr:ABC transporter ATP-binding protein [Verrucomicrobiae bacterium]
MNSQRGAPSSAGVVVRGVRKRFGTLDALDGLDLEIRGGEIYGLLGPNGSGKTTLIRCIAGLVQPDAGEITVLGRTPRDVVAAGRVGYMTQAAALYGDLSIDENLEFFARLEGVEDADARIEAVLRTVDLLDRRRSIVSTLSGGMRQRVSLAVALACDPALLIADEPTTALDVTTEAQILDLMRELQQEIGMSIMFVTHNLGVVAQMCDEVAVM